VQFCFDHFGQASSVAHILADAPRAQKSNQATVPLKIGYPATQDICLPGRAELKLTHRLVRPLPCPPPTPGSGQAHRAHWRPSSQVARSVCCCRPHMPPGRPQKHSNAQPACHAGCRPTAPQACSPASQPRPGRSRRRSGRRILCARHTVARAPPSLVMRPGSRRGAARPARAAAAPPPSRPGRRRCGTARTGMAGPPARRRPRARASAPARAPGPGSLARPLGCVPATPLPATTSRLPAGCRARRAAKTEAACTPRREEATAGRHPALCVSNSARKWHPLRPEPLA